MIDPWNIHRKLASLFDRVQTQLKLRWIVLIIVNIMNAYYMSGPGIVSVGSYVYFCDQFKLPFVSYHMRFH